jgi:molybdenum cofactor cytidylyltransferase
MRLLEALRLNQAPRLALVGAGGKTTAMFHLARQLLTSTSGLAPTVLVTTTTHLGINQINLADRHIILQSPVEIDFIKQDLPQGVILFTGPSGNEDRVAGLNSEILAGLHAFAESHRLPLLMEADGSRGRPLKAPAAHEPVIPSWVKEVLVVAGLSAIGQPLEERWVHRPERFAELAGLEMGAFVSVEGLGHLLANPQGGLKGIPPTARRIALLNQADTPELQAAGFNLAEHLLGAYHAVLVASLAPSPPFREGSGGDPTGSNEQVVAAFEPVAGIILAAGAATRLGRPKQALPWRGQPLVRHVALAALSANLSPLVIITGAYPDLVQQALEGLPVQIIHNPDWQLGLSASVRCAVNALPESVGAAVFLLADQPQVPVTLMRNLVEIHAHSQSPIVAPLVDGQRANPVLFDRQTFSDLQNVTGDAGGRALFARYPVEWLPWHDANLLLDVDSPEDYQMLLDLE